jgi:hypothetical protein
MDLALVTGRGPSDVTNLEGRRPLVRLFRWNTRSLSACETMNSIMIAWPKKCELSIPAELQMLAFWVHFAVDVLDDAIMPAVDYRNAHWPWALKKSRICRTSSCAAVKISIRTAASPMEKCTARI